MHGAACLERRVAAAGWALRPDAFLVGITPLLYHQNNVARVCEYAVRRACSPVPDWV